MKIRHLLFGMLAMAATVACQQEEPADVAKLEVSTEAVALEATAAEATFEVTSSQDWVATADADWVTLDPASGEASTEAAVVKVTAEDNEATEARTATVTVTAGELVKTVTLTQAAAEPTPEPVDVDIDGKQWQFTWQVMGGVPSLIDLGVTMPGIAILAVDGGAFDPSLEGVYVPYIAAEYTIAKTNGTSGVVTLTAEDQSVEIPYSNATETTVHLASAAFLNEDIDCTLAASKIDIMMEEPEPEPEPEPEGPQAITVAEFLALEVGTTEYQLTGVIEGTYNTTYGNFYLNDGTAKVLVYGLTATPQTSNDKSFASLGLRDGDTLTLIGQRADYNGTAQVGGPAYYVSHVAAPYVDFAVGSATVDAEATTYSIELESNVAWTATASAGVTLNPASGEGNGTVVMTFAANTSNDPIDHTVTFAAGELTMTFTLTQKGVPAADAEPRYVKVTEDQADWSGKYLIVFGSNAHATLSGKDLVSTKAVNIVGGEIEATSDLDAAVMTVTKNGDKYVMTYPDGKYFSMVKNSSSSSTTAFDLTFAYTANGVKISGVASGTTYILYHNSNNGNFYRCYVDKNGQSGYTLPTLYKYTE